MACLDRASVKKLHFSKEVSNSRDINQVILLQLLKFEDARIDKNKQVCRVK